MSENVGEFPMPDAVEQSVSSIPGDAPKDVIKDTSPIDWSKVTIPDEVLKRDPRYREVLDESIKRRQQIKALKTQLEEPEEKKPAPQETKSPQPSQPEDRIDRIEKMLASIVESSQAERKAMAVKVLADKYGLPPEATAFLKGDTAEELEASASTLANLLPKKSVPSTSTSAGNPGKTDASALVDAIKARMAANFDFEKNDGIFGSGVQRQKGGGAIS